MKTFNQRFYSILFETNHYKYSINYSKTYNANKMKNHQPRKKRLLLVLMSDSLNWYGVRCIGNFNVHPIDLYKSYGIYSHLLLLLLFVNEANRRKTWTKWTSTIINQTIRHIYITCYCECTMDVLETSV